MDLEILKIASDTKNHKIIKDYTYISKQKNRMCGDEMEITVKIENEKIVDFGYQCKSCIYCQASASLLAKESKNKTILKIKSLLKTTEDFFVKTNINFPKEWITFTKLFNKNNISRKECLMLPFSALSKIIKKQT
tara:strand:+ start:2934 stop:3338 length:405 start_codon:yes stop_codon:yes gene_type:complete